MAPLRLPRGGVKPSGWEPKVNEKLTKVSPPRGSRRGAFFTAPLRIAFPHPPCCE